MSDSDLQKRVDELEAQLREAKAKQADPSTDSGDEVPPPPEPEKPEEEEPTVGTGTAIALAAIAATVLLIVIGLLYVLIAALL